MAVARFGYDKPEALVDSLVYTVERTSLISVVAANLSGATTISSWLVPQGQDAAPENWIYFANEVPLTSRNTFETFKTAANVGDKLYVNSANGEVTFFVNGIYDTTGTTDVTVGEYGPESPQIGSLWIHNTLDPAEVKYWDGTEWQNTGIVGPAGPGFATGGSTGQLLAKSSNANYETEWVDMIIPPNALDDLSDVVITNDPVLGTPKDRQTIQYDETVAKWTNKAASGGVTISATPPVGSLAGDAWFNSTDGTMYVYYSDGFGTVRNNYVTNPSFEVNTTGWVANSTTISRIPSDKYLGDASLQIAATLVNNYCYTDAAVELTGNTTYIASAWVKGEFGKTITLAIEERTDEAAVGIQVSSALPMTGEWQRISVSKPFGATGIVARVRIQNATSGAHTFIADAVMVEAGSTLNDYFDGSSENAIWAGTANNSLSQFTSPTENASQWVQVKANTALEASILSRLSGVETRTTVVENSATALEGRATAVENRATAIESINPLLASSATARNALFPSPAQGNTVYRTDLGYMERYYAAWNATTNPSGTTGSPGWFEYRGGAALSHNHIINGAFNIWQRGTTATNNTGYLADRWAVTANLTGNQCNQSKVLGPNSQLTNALRIQQTQAGTAVIEYAARQVIERINMQTVAGKTVTLSFWYRSNRTGAHGARIIGNAGANVGGNNFTTNFNVTTADVWTKYSITTEAPFGTVTGYGAGAETLPGAYVDIGFKVNGGTNFPTLNANDYFEIAGVMLEEGPVATTFRMSSPTYQDEFSACQRYLEFGSSKWYSNVSASYAVLSVNYKVNKRAVPTVTTFTAGGRAWQPTGLEWNELDGFCAARNDRNEIGYYWKSECEL